jgi:hypothetical protein
MHIAHLARTENELLASPARTQGSSARSPSGRSAPGSIPWARGRAKTGRHGAQAHRPHRRVSFHHGCEAGGLEGEGVESSTVRQPTEAEFFLWYFCSAYNERGDQRMTRLARVRTRRELLRATASISFLGLARRFASADPGNVDNQGNHYGW